MRKLILFNLIILVSGAFFLSSCDKDDEKPEKSTIVELAVNNGYNVLAAAVVLAGLDDDLGGPGPFTLFAPTDAAFNAAGITASNVGQVEGLENILKYHVVSGKLMSGDLTDGELVMLNGALADLNVMALTINDKNITEPFDLEGSNGVIHTINGLLMPPMNVVETAAATADLSILVSLLGKFPAVVDALSDENGTLTVFAPTNAAFDELLGVIGQSSADDIPEEVLLSILQYHVLASEVYSENLSDGLTATTLNGEDIVVEQAGNSYTISGATINSADVMTSNGVVHIMDNVLVPPTVGVFVNTIVEPAYFNKNFSTLISAVKAASPSIMDLLLGDGPGGNGMTLFAPTNAAFEAAGITSLPDQTTLDAVLAYHLLDGMILSTQLPFTSVAAPATVSSAGCDFYLSNSGNGVFINGSTEVTATDIDPSEGAGTANGVVHVIDRTLVPPSQDIVAIAIAGGFNKLAEALTEANLVSTLQGAGPFTVFAPTDAAFDELYSALGVSGPDKVADETLEAVLLYHVVGARVFSTDLADGLMPATVGGATFMVNIGESGVTISDGANSDPDAMVTVVNILGSNGVIHVIDKVILPPAE